MERPYIFSVIIPERFEPTLNEFETLAGKDKEFLKALEKIENKYAKKNKKNRLRSAKIRFVISKYVIEKKKELLKEKNV